MQWGPNPLVSLVWTKDATYRLASFQSESDLEAAINQVKAELFGEHRIYLDVKKKIGAKAGLRNIPDGYLIDLSGQRPRLYVVENELASHDGRHLVARIGAQASENGNSLSVVILPARRHS